LGDENVDDYTQRVLYAGFWKRFLASLIDSIIFAIPILMLTIFFSYVGLLIIVIGGWVYCAVMESSEKQATLGKIALKSIVTDINGNKISFERATGRYFAKIISNIFYIGYIMAAFTAKKQGLHDIIAKTLVSNKWVVDSISNSISYCPFCKAQNAYNATFCCSCGKQLSTGYFICKKCGSKIQDGSKFCSTCGTQKD
jgi:uncharacterized RDD family membrane protein YckC